jgi:hypothetical protein
LLAYALISDGNETNCEMSLLDIDEDVVSILSISVSVWDCVSVWCLMTNLFVRLSQNSSWPPLSMIESSLGNAESFIECSGDEEDAVYEFCCCCEALPFVSWAVPNRKRKKCYNKENTFPLKVIADLSILKLESVLLIHF